MHRDDCAAADQGPNSYSRRHRDGGAVPAIAGVGRSCRRRLSGHQWSSLRRVWLHNWPAEH